MPTIPIRRPPFRALPAFALSAAMAVPAAGADWLLPSSARWPGLGGAFFTTELSVANRDTRDVTVTLKFYRHDENGSYGPEVSYPLRSGEALTIPDVLKRAFGYMLDWGAIRVRADTTLLSVTSQTSTPADGAGTFGQAVPGFSGAELVRHSRPATIAGIRQGAGARTNLVLANAIDDQITVHAELFGPDGAPLGPGRDWVLPPFGMTQASSFVEEMAGPGSAIDGGRVVLRSSPPDASFAAYACVIDDATNDPRTLLPASLPEPSRTWIVPSSAHAPGARGAFYTTDLTLANSGEAEAFVTIRFLGHDADGTNGPVRDVAVAAGATLPLRDVLGSLFGLTEGYGALLVTATTPDLVVVAETSTPSAGGGVFGQGVPAVPAASFTSPGSTLWIGGIREDASFRTNLVLANPASGPVTVRAELRDEDGTSLASGSWDLPPLGMTQVGRVVETLLGAGETILGGQLFLSTQTPGGAFATYASVIDNSTNDPRTILPR